MGPTPTDGAGSGTGSSTEHFKPGDKVEARWGETTWYPATVTADNGDWVNGKWHTHGTYEVEYDDGEVRSYTAERIRCTTRFPFPDRATSDTLRRHAVIPQPENPRTLPSTGTVMRCPHCDARQ